MHTTSEPLGFRGRIRTFLVAIAASIAAAALLVTLVTPGADASVERGGANPDVLVGADNDNADNTAIQPVGVAAKQHLDNLDLLTGSQERDLLIGRTGPDVLIGEAGDDILIGGLEGGTLPDNSDVLIGSFGNDINIWTPGDGSEIFDGGPGRDVMVLSQIENVNRDITLFDFGDIKVPRILIDARPQFTCTIERAPATDGLNVDAVVRFFANGTLAVTVRLVNVEQVLCPNANAGKVNAAEIGDGNDTFVERTIPSFKGTIGAIMGNGLT